MATASRLPFLPAILFLLAFLLYANTLGHGFTLDDQVVITQNRYIQQGLSRLGAIFLHDSFQGYLSGGAGDTPVLTGGRYRPLSLALFTLVHQMAGNQAWAYHLLAVLLYALTCFLLYTLLMQLLKEQTQWLPLLATALFVVHPVHTEVVANVKGCDEILALLGALVAWRLLLKAVDQRRIAWALAGGVAFFLACLAKESAVAFAVVIPLSLLLFRGASARNMVAWSAAMWVALVLFLLLRGNVLGWQFSGQMMHDPLNNPFLQFDGRAWVPFTFMEKAATIVYCLGQYLRLLVWPWPLTHDYYPRHIDMMNFSMPVVWASAVVWVVLLLFVVQGFWKMRTSGIDARPNWISIWFGALLLVLTLALASNVLFPVGTFMGERFLFAPSVGFCLIIATGAGYFLKIKKALAWVVFGALLVLFSGKTLVRNRAWHDNETLFRTDIMTSANSAKAQSDLGNILLTRALTVSDPAEQQRLFLEADQHLDRAIALHPTYYDANLAEGACAYYLGDFPGAIAAYRVAFQLYPTDEKARIGLAWSLRDGGRFFLEKKNDPAHALPLLMEAAQLLPQDTATQRMIKTLQKQ